MALFLRDKEVSQCVSIDEMLDAIESMQRHFGQGEAYNLPRRKIIASGGLLAVMGGGLFYDGVLGVKTYTVVKGQPIAFQYRLHCRRYADYYVAIPRCLFIAGGRDNVDA